MLKENKYVFSGKKKIISTIMGVVGAGLLAAVAMAAPGDPVPPGSITPPGPAGNGCGGIGVAYDGATIWYNCSLEAKLRKTNTAGADLGFVDTTEGGNPIHVDAIAWDPNEGRIWGTGLVDTDNDGSDDICRIYSIDPATGNATTRFDRTDLGCSDSPGLNFTFVDGLTVDPITNTIYFGPDVQKNIYHLNKTGAAAANGTIDFETLTSVPDRCPGTEPVPDNDLATNGCNNSGLAIGLDGTLFVGTDGEGKIIQINPNTPAFLSEFATVSGRDEDLECGPVVQGKETILSRDLFFPGRIDILEAPEGTCTLPDIDLDPPKDENEIGDNHSVTTTITLGASPVSGVLVSFEVIAGPNAGEVSDPNSSECTVNGDCTTDANGQVSWTYTSNGEAGSDTIEACFIDLANNEHCVEVEKDWLDTTPPEADCVESVNPHGKKIPPAGSTTLPGPRGGQNEDGFYHLGAKDNSGLPVQIFIENALGDAIFGPFVSSTTVKITEAPGTTPSSKKIGSSNGQAGAVAAHITLDSDPVMLAIDAAGNVTTVSCLVPPPPK